LGGGENHLHNGPEAAFISKPVVAKSLFPSSFFHLPLSAGQVAQLCPTGCCPWRWGGHARAPQLFPNAVILLSQRMKISVMTSNTLLPPCDVQLTTAPSFTLSLFIHIYLVILFDPAWGGGADTRSGSV